MCIFFFFFFFFKQKTAYEMRISDWSSDVCSSDLDRLLIGHVDMIGSGLPALCNDRCSIFFGLRHLDVDEGYCCAPSGKIPRTGGPPPLCFASNDGHFSVPSHQFSDLHQPSHSPIECRFFFPES